MNLKKELINPRGLKYEMSFYTPQDLEQVKKEKNLDTVKVTDLPRETVGNVILNCLTQYAVADKKEVFYVHALSKWLLVDAEEKKELPEKLYKFLTEKLLPDSVHRKNNDPKKEGGIETEETKENLGLYTAWVMGQVYEELGVDMLFGDSDKL